MRTLSADKIEQVAWIRTGALGDLLISTAALSETQNRFPSSKIWVVGSRLWTQLLDPVIWPRVTAILECEDGFRVRPYFVYNGEWRLAPTFTGDDKSHDSLRLWLKNCQATINHRTESYRFTWAPLLSGVPLRVGSCPWIMSWLYSHHARWLGKDPQIHERDFHLLVAEAPPRNMANVFMDLFSESDPVETETSKSDGIKKWQSKGLPRLRVFDENLMKTLTGCKYKQYLLINPTASRREKAWASKKFEAFLKIVEPIAQICGLRVFVVGSSSESVWLNEVSDKNVIQPKDLRELTSLVEGAAMLVTNASSMQFIATGVGTPCLTLMGRANPEIWGPLGVNDSSIKSNSPINSVKIRNIFEEERRCYDTISVEEVVDKFVCLMEQVVRAR